MKDKTLVVFHRCGGKSLDYPPNTILTAQWAEKQGARAIEYDVVLCKDSAGYEIAVIEPKLLKKANLDINNLIWSEVQKLDTGNQKFGHCRVPLLEEMLAAVDNLQVGHQIHIKGENPFTVKTLVPLLKKLDDYLVTSFDLFVLKEVKSIDTSIPVGWIVKPKQETGSEGTEDLTAAVTANADTLEGYSGTELDEVLQEAKDARIDTVILCGPRIQDASVVQKIKDAGFEVGAWGVGTNLDLAKRLIGFQLNRFTLDNPEELTV